MKIVCLKGGLGNQMFEYCRFRDLMESGHDEVYLVYAHRRLNPHNGWRLSDGFELEIPSAPGGGNRGVGRRKICRAVGVLKRLYDDEKPEAVLIDDYSQHRRFIPNARRYFFFRQFLAELQSGFVQMIRAVDYPVSVPVRVVPIGSPDGGRNMTFDRATMPQPGLVAQRHRPLEAKKPYPAVHLPHGLV